MDLLTFSVQGSAPQPYRVTFRGAGAALEAFCTCPAGAKSRIGCKHVAALLMGDVTSLIAGEAGVTGLRDRASGSALAAWALTYAPAKPKTAEPQIDGERPYALDTALRLVLLDVMASGCDVAASADAVIVFRRTATGRRAQPAICEMMVASHEPEAYVVVTPTAERAFTRLGAAALHLQKTVQSKLARMRRG